MTIEDLLKLFPFKKPSRIVTNIAGDSIAEWQDETGNGYFEIDKEPESQEFEIMIENEDGGFEHWELKKLG